MHGRTGSRAKAPCVPLIMEVRIKTGMLKVYGSVAQVHTPTKLVGIIATGPRLVK